MKKERFVVTVTIRDGEHEYNVTHLCLVDVKGDMIQLDKFMRDFYDAKGSGEWKEIDNDYRLICVHSYKEVSDEEYEILKKFL